MTHLFGNITDGYDIHAYGRLLSDDGRRLFRHIPGRVAVLRHYHTVYYVFYYSFYDSDKLLMTAVVSSEAEELKNGILIGWLSAETERRERYYLGIKSISNLETANMAMAGWPLFIVI